MHRTQFIVLVLFILLIGSSSVRSEITIDWAGSLNSGFYSGVLPAHFATSGRHGRISANSFALFEGLAIKPLDLSKRFSWSAGIDLIGGMASSAVYERYESASSQWTGISQSPSHFWIQQAFAEIKWRGVFLTIGAKEQTSRLVNFDLSSGDLTYSGNTRPLPEIRVGFVDFQDIPLTNGWVQIEGVIGYGHTTDGDWWTNRYNRYNYHVTSGSWYNYKRCYFRTKPTQRFSATIGMQAACVFGGCTERYQDGILVQSVTRDVDIKSFWNAFLPTRSGKEGFYEGNHLGTWDLRLSYLLPSSNSEISLYVEKPWEDGSGIGFRNGWDGLWGLEYKASSPQGWITRAVIEYLDLTNQSGPIHFAPGDFPGNTIGSEATGGDDYYNNAFYNAYAYYGLSLGSPMVMSPFYNTDGYLAYIGNRMRGFHVAANGLLGLTEITWRLRLAWRKAWGNAHITLPQPISATSVALNLSRRIPGLSQLTVGLELDLDRGRMPDNNFGAMVTVSYDGSFTFLKP